MFKTVKGSSLEDLADKLNSVKARIVSVQGSEALIEEYFQPDHLVSVQKTIRLQDGRSYRYSMLDEEERHEYLDKKGVQIEKEDFDLSEKDYAKKLQERSSLIDGVKPEV